MNKSTLSVCAIGLMTLAGTQQSQAQELIYAVTNTQNLVTWDSSAPGNLLSGVALSGLASNETIRGIDFRPATGELFALGSFNNLYTVNALTGSERAIGHVNEVLDPNIVSSGYTNSVMGATSTQLYGIDTGLDILVTQANSAGTLMTVGSLGVDLNDTASFDISGFSGIAYGTVQAADQSKSVFWSVNLATGQSSTIGDIGGGALITAMTTAVPTPAGALLFGAALPFAARRRR